MEFKKTDAADLLMRPIGAIADEWMLVTAGSVGNCNTMTASWGALGELWGRHVAVIFIRPQRHTFGFVEDNGLFTLSFFGGGRRDALKLCGSRSGRDIDKIAASGLTPWATEGGSVAFREATLVLECRKVYADFLKREAFIDPGLIEHNYPAGDFHRMYVGEITAAWRKE